MASPLFDLTTEVAPARIFTVDGVEYKLLGLEHLGKDEEARTQALFARYSKLASALPNANNRQKAERLAATMYDLRMELLCSLTDLPRDVAEKLPMSGQIKLMSAIASDVEDEESDDEGAGADEDIDA